MENVARDRTAIFSVKPKYAALIFSGAKTVELRRTNPRSVTQGTRILFWESSPSKRFVGSARVVRVLKVPVEELWMSISGSAGVSREEFDKYFEGAENGIALFLSDAMEFVDKPHLSILRHKLGFRPPQSFRYASHAELQYLAHQNLICGEIA